ncbi:predicted protein [Chaetomium globosum CBS 148.51]|uniref:Uncharacterized protein n=1 Tax=Chaetomium globosum (strain ATCC 6205 / CBS 148.51 / DSM 1962 / NBRC 6347 / NRRL 1970) TaxID=306901 RepID=Q2GP38_CHAGB|nr:uncharacterized protein CHGG_10266 [Chaetomium globosum CBS 148.51]EAQ83862.1 predicted protein [Chaetomium globosum CBS 148.51]
MVRCFVRSRGCSSESRSLCKGPDSVPRPASMAQHGSAWETISSPAHHQWPVYWKLLRPMRRQNWGTLPRCKASNDDIDFPPMGGTAPDNSGRVKGTAGGAVFRGVGLMPTGASKPHVVDDLI